MNWATRRNTGIKNLGYTVEQRNNYEEWPNYRLSRSEQETFSCRCQEWLISGLSLQRPKQNQMKRNRLVYKLPNYPRKKLTNYIATILAHTGILSGYLERIFADSWRL